MGVTVADRIGRDRGGSFGVTSDQVVDQLLHRKLVRDGDGGLRGASSDRRALHSHNLVEARYVNEKGRVRAEDDLVA